uniref:Uncharacterized protein n=1 Tax=Cacopsylla melanoneura TaxID=428564 RepID=A0A8D8UAU8_9HEMI
MFTSWRHLRPLPLPARPVLASPRPRPPPPVTTMTRTKSGTFATCPIAPIRTRIRTLSKSFPPIVPFRTVASFSSPVRKSLVQRLRPARLRLSDLTHRRDCTR